MRNRKHGFVVLEVLIALAIVSMLATLLIVTMQKHRQVSRQLAQQRQAAWHLEALMTAMQSSASAARPALEPPIDFKWLSQPGPLSGHAWVRLSTTVGRKEVALTGLVRIDAAARVSNTPPPDTTRLPDEK